MEKNLYEAPKSEFVKFEMGDIIATYGESEDPTPAPTVPTVTEGNFTVQ